MKEARIEEHEQIAGHTGPDKYVVVVNPVPQWSARRLFWVKPAVISILIMPNRCIRSKPYTLVPSGFSFEGTEENPLVTFFR